MPVAKEKVDNGKSTDEAVEAQTKMMEKIQASMIHAIRGEMAEFTRDNGQSTFGDAQHHSRVSVVFREKSREKVERTKGKEFSTTEDRKWSAPL